MSRRLVIAILIATLTASAAAAPSSEGLTRAFRAKPSGITCAALRLRQRSATLRCDLRFLGRRAVFLHARGKGKVRRVSSFLHPRHRMVLRRGHTASLGPFRCTSLRTAVSCRSENGHGFTMGPKFQLVF